MRRDVFQAIADPTRRVLLVMMTTQAMSLSVLSEHFSISRQAISKHIKILQECELVIAQTQGREVYYRLNVLPMKSISDWLEPFRAHWEGQFKALDQLLTEI